MYTYKKPRTLTGADGSITMDDTPQPIYGESVPVTFAEVYKRTTQLDVVSGNPYREDGSFRFASRDGTSSPDTPRTVERARRRASVVQNPESSLMFASPEQRTGRSIYNAQNDVRTGQQREFREAQSEVLGMLGIEKGTTQDALGLWKDPTDGVGAEASTATFLPRGISHDDATLAAVMMGRLTNQKAVIAYTPDKTGKDLRVTVQGLQGKATAVYKHFADAGIENVTLVRDAQGWTAHLLGFHEWGGDDAQQKMLASANTIGRANGASKLTYSTGTASYVGAETREDANTEYDRRINAAQAGGVAGNRGRDFDGRWDALLSQWKNRQPGRRVSRGVTKEDATPRLSALLDVVEAWADVAGDRLLKNATTLSVVSGNPYRNADSMTFASAEGGSGALATAEGRAFLRQGVNQPVEPDALIPPPVLTMTNSAFGLMNEKARATFRNQAADAIIADRALAGANGRVTRKSIDAVLGGMHASLHDMTPQDVASISKSVRDYEQTFAQGTNFRNWDAVDELRVLGSQGDADAWYISNDIIKEVFHEAADARVFTLLLAVTSQRNAVPQNTGMALNLLLQYRAAGRKIPEGGFLGGMTGVMENAANVIRDGAVAGSKIGEFVRALDGDPNAVVTDIWMARAFGLKTDTPTDREHRIIQRIVTTKAKELGMTPSSLQAAIWNGAARADFVRRGRPFPEEDFKGYGSQLLRRARDTDPEFKRTSGSGKNKITLPIPADHEYFGMFSQASVRTWEIIGGSTYKRALLGQIRDRIRTRSRFYKVDRASSALRMLLALTVLEAGLDERKWRRLVSTALGGVPPNGAWESACRDAEPFFNAGRQFNIAAQTESVAKRAILFAAAFVTVSANHPSPLP